MKYSQSLLALMTLGLSACAGLTGPVIMGGDAAGMYLTKPATPPPADTADQIPQHESWCYQTMGEAQCFAHAQDVPPDRLINVDPQSRYPVDLAAYHQVLVAPPSSTVVVQTTTVEPVAMEPAAVIQPAAVPYAPAAPEVQTEKDLKDELDNDVPSDADAHAPPMLLTP